MQDKVKVGVTSATGYGVSLAAVVAAALDYIGGDHSAPTRTTLVLGAVAGVSFVVTQAGRYAQAHAQIRVAPQVINENRIAAQEARWAQNSDVPEAEDQAEAPSWLPDEGPMVAGTGEQDIGAINSEHKKVYWPETDAHADPGPAYDFPPDLHDEPEDDGSDQVPHHETRDLHDGGRC